MFITRKQYDRILDRLYESEKAIADLILNADETERILNERIEALEDESDKLSDERKKEKYFEDGLSNIMNYQPKNGGGVKYGN